MRVSNAQVVRELESIARDISSAACGRCYEKAYRYVKKYGGTLVHGSYRDRHKIIHNHAWVEDGDLLIDPSVDLKDSKIGLKRRGFNYRTEAEYSQTGAMVNLLKNKHYGPWHR